MIIERMILARLQWKTLKTKNIFGKAVVVTFMDLDNAFERVDHLSMLDSLIYLGISGRIIAWIENFLTNTKFKVKIQGTISDPHDHGFQHN